jgi:hypothetical protein
MSWTAKAALAAALLNCGLSNASADTPNSPDSKTGSWLKDGDCALFSAGAAPGDSVTWIGACVDGYAQGLGTATFTHAGQSQSFTANFVQGVIPDGHVITRWGQGWSYDGETMAGRFNGAGILTTNTADRFEGVWTDGKMNGFGILRRANGERYAGDWKDDRPNGKGELRHADGTLLNGTFVDGKLADAAAAKAALPASGMAQLQAEKAVDKTSDAPAPNAPFGSVSGKTLIGVDGSSIALTVIEGGMELQVVPVDGTAKKTTFTFMTDRMGTVVEDGASPSAGSSVTGFFRLTGKGVEIRYADGRSAMLSSSPEGGVQMALDTDSGPTCHAWYPAGHSFSEVEKKMALNAYASKLGLPVVASVASSGCSFAPKTAGIAPSPSAAAPSANPPAGATAPSAPAAKAKPERKAQTKVPLRTGSLREAPVRMAKASYRIGDYQPGTAPKADLESVSVKTSEIHTIDAPAADAAQKSGAIAVPSISGAMAMTPPVPSPPSAEKDASRCLKVDSDGKSWGFRNSCDFTVQFAYCMADGDSSLTACGDKGVVTTSVGGSVAANGFGALSADTSLKDKDGSYKFRWVACAGGAGEVVARLDRADPPAGRCERARSASN